MAELKLSQDVLEWREVEGEIVGLDLAAREYVSINRTGAAIWPLLVEGATREELAEKLIAQFEIERAQAVTDADVFVAQLAERGLLTES